MQVSATELAGVLCIQPRVFRDERGHFLESFSAARYAAAGIEGPFVQDNVSVSRHRTLRGLHLQEPHAQGKLVYVVEGEVLDVAVDLRLGSPSFGRWVRVTLSAENCRQLYVPRGFAHGYCVTSARAVVIYKCTDSYHPECELTVAWDDPTLGVAWPTQEPGLSDRDRAAPRLADIPTERLPRYQG